MAANRLPFYCQSFALSQKSSVPVLSILLLGSFYTLINKGLYNLFKNKITLAFILHFRSQVYLFRSDYGDQFR